MKYLITMSYGLLIIKIIIDSKGQIGVWRGNCGAEINVKTVIFNVKDKYNKSTKNYMFGSILSHLQIADIENVVVH